MAAHNDMQFCINGEVWRLQRKKLRRNWGFCDWDERRIVVDSRLSGERELEVILHEIDHAHHRHHDEQHVLRIARETAAILHAIGYRLG